MKYNVAFTLKKLEKLQKYPRVRKPIKKNGFNANMFLQECNKRRKLKQGKVKSIKDAIALINFELS